MHSVHGNNRLHSSSSSINSVGPKQQERAQQIAQTRNELKMAHLDLHAAKSRHAAAWKDLNSTRRSTGISAAEYQLKQTPAGETGNLERKIAEKEAEFAPVLNGHHDRIRAAEGDIAKSESQIRQLDGKLLRLESDPILERRPLPTPLAPHASLMRPSGAETRSSPLAQVPTHPSADMLLDGLVPTAGVPFQLGNPITHPNLPSTPLHGHEVNLKRPEE